MRSYQVPTTTLYRKDEGQFKIILLRSIQCLSSVPRSITAIPDLLLIISTATDLVLLDLHHLHHTQRALRIQNQPLEYCQMGYLP